MTTLNLVPPIDPQAIAQAPTATRPAHGGQARMAERLANQYEGKLIHVDGSGWYRYDGQRWTTRGATGVLRRAILQVTEDAADAAEQASDKALLADARCGDTDYGIKGVAAIAAHLPQFERFEDDLDGKPNLLNLQNGTLDLDTMVFRDADPADCITKVCGASWTPGATSEAFDRFLGVSLPNVAIRDYLQRVAGMALHGTVFDHVLPVWTGVGGNGKSVLIEALFGAFGDYAVTAEPELLMARDNAHPTGLMVLKGARLAVMAETGKGCRVDEPTMKRLTGGDRITARRMRQDFVEFKASHTCVLITNHKPEVDGDDDGVRRRVSIIPFDVVVSEAEKARNANIGQKLSEQDARDAVMAWALAGWAEYRSQGLNPPPDVQHTTEEYLDDSRNGILGFLDFYCVTSDKTDSANRMTTADLYNRWLIYEKNFPVEPFTSMRAFGKALTEAGFPAATYMKSDGKGYRWGIRLKLSHELSSNEE